MSGKKETEHETTILNIKFNPENLQMFEADNFKGNTFLSALKTFLWTDKFHMCLHLVHVHKCTYMHTHLLK